MLLFMAVPARAPSAQEIDSQRLELSLGQALGELRSAIAEYRFDHSGWPGFDPRLAATLGPRAADAGWFERQLTMHTDRAGEPVPQALPTHPFGPYLLGGLPTNPLTGSRAVRVLAVDEAIPREPAGGGGWIYSPTSGEILPDGIGDAVRHRAEVVGP